MKLDFEVKKPNTTGVQFRIDPDTKKQMNALKKYYGVRTGQLIKKMIQVSYAAVEGEIK
jgi:antitoxin component of RelBE/YafQ-DinJ toxin-antitoxin module